MYRLATILLIGSAAALKLAQTETANMAQVKAAECLYSEDLGEWVGCENEPEDYIYCWENEDGEEECEEEGLGEGLAQA